MISNEELTNEKLIIRAKSGCQHSKNDFFHKNRKLAALMANRYKKRGSHEHIDDLISIANIGLVLAYNNFDPSQNIKFSTYACKCISNEFGAMARKSSMKCRSKYSSISLDEHSRGRKSDELENDRHSYVGDNDYGYIEIEEDMFSSKLSAMVNKSTLTDGERSVMRAYLFDGRNLTEIAETMNVSRQGVHQKFHRGFKRLEVNFRKILAEK